MAVSTKHQDLRDLAESLGMKWVYPTETEEFPYAVERNTDVGVTETKFFRSLREAEVHLQKIAKEATEEDEG